MSSSKVEEIKTVEKRVVFDNARFHGEMPFLPKNGIYTVEELRKEIEKNANVKLQYRTTQYCYDKQKGYTAFRTTLKVMFFENVRELVQGSYNLYYTANRMVWETENGLTTEDSIFFDRESSRHAI